MKNQSCMHATTTLKATRRMTLVPSCKQSNVQHFERMSFLLIPIMATKTPTFAITHNPYKLSMLMAIMPESNIKNKLP